MTKQCEEVVERLREIQDEMLILLDEASGLIAATGNQGALRRAESYWIAHVTCGLTEDHDYLGGDGVTLDDTIRELSGEDE